VCIFDAFKALCSRNDTEAAEWEVELNGQNNAVLLKATSTTQHGELKTLLPVKKNTGRIAHSK